MRLWTCVCLSPCRISTRACCTSTVPSVPVVLRCLTTGNMLTMSSPPNAGLWRDSNEYSLSCTWAQRKGREGGQLHKDNPLGVMFLFFVFCTYKDIETDAKEKNWDVKSELIFHKTGFLAFFVDGFCVIWEHFQYIFIYLSLGNVIFRASWVACGPWAKKSLTPLT